MRRGRGLPRPGSLRVAVGAVSDRPQFFPELCPEGADPAAVGSAYAEAIDPISDVPRFGRSTGGG